MTLLQLVLIALIQGITEWLPISSSAHLILLPEMMNEVDQGLLIDAMAHLGSLLAMLIYFRKDIARVIWGVLDLILCPINKTAPSANGRLALCILIATPPGLLAGFLYQLLGAELIFRNTHIIALATIAFGVLLWWADRTPRYDRIETNMRMRDAIWIGVAQTLAFIPGASRSGVTITAARYMGFDRREAARFSMLLGGPLLAAAGAYAFLQLARLPDADTIGYSGLIAGLWVMGLSFIAAYISICGFMVLLSRFSFMPFIIYRFILGGALLAYAYF